MDADQTTQIAMQILVDAGHAKTILSDLLDELAVNTTNYSTPNKNLKKAHEWLIKAHIEQNKLMQSAEEIKYSILLTHAQDTLMNTETIYFITARFLPIITKKEK